MKPPGGPHHPAVDAVIAEVGVERTAEGLLEVVWAVAGACERVDVAWGRSADGGDHEHVLTVPAASGRTTLDPAALGGQRMYVSVAPAGAPGGLVAAERRVDLRGPVNFRDLGGYRTATGARVRWGRVFRSDAILLSDDDLARFSDLGIRTVYDLRSEVERSVHPNRFPDGQAPRVELLPLVSEDPALNPMEGIDPSDGERFLEQLYLHILERSAPNFGRVLSGLAEELDLPAVFHCAAGKDRTGMVAAVLLCVLGVPLVDVLDDYELTARYRTTEHVNANMNRLGRDQSLAPEVVAGMLRSPRWAMESALATIAGRYGGFDEYLSGPAGASPTVGEQLRRVLLTD
jgi:protein-tyrosine phosphatase